MQFIDLVGAMAASRHARAITVTASMDHLDFVAPVHVGRSAHPEIEREPGVPDLDGGWCEGDGGGYPQAGAAACKLGLHHVRGGGSRGQGSAGAGAGVRDGASEAEVGRRRGADARCGPGETLRKKRLREELGSEWNV